MNTVKTNKINKIVTHLLSKASITKPPVDVEKIATMCNIEIRKKPFEDKEKLSGVLVRDSNKVVIGVNSNDNSHRQRFTIAHEIGHFFLHEIDQIFIDKAFGVHFRNDKSSLGIDVKEIEANAFASLLLIPDEFILQDLQKKSIDIMDDSLAISNLADKYEVSLQAMNLKLGKLLSGI